MRYLPILLAIICISTAYAQTQPLSPEKLEQARQDIEGLKEMGYITSRLEVSYQHVLDAYSQGQLDEARSEYSSLRGLLAEAIAIAGRLNDTDQILGRMEEHGFNISELAFMKGKAEYEYSLNNYEAANLSLISLSDRIAGRMTDYTRANIAAVQALAGNDSTLAEERLGQVLEGYFTSLNQNKSYTLLMTYNLSALNDSIQAYHASRALVNLSGIGNSSRIGKSLGDLDGYLAAGDLENTDRMVREIASLVEEYGKYRNDSLQLAARKKELEEIGLQPEDLPDLISSAELEAGYENYARADELVQEGLGLLEQTEQEHMVMAVFARAEKRFTLIQAIKENWIIVLISLIIGIILFRIGKSSVDKKLCQLRKANLASEKDSIKKLLVELQLSYFKKNAIGLETYNSQRENYEKRMIQIDKDLELLDSLPSRAKPDNSHHGNHPALRHDVRDGAKRKWYSFDKKIGESK